MKPVLEECIKSGKLIGFNVWKRTYATNVGGESNYTISFSFSTLDQALSWASGKTSPADEYKRYIQKKILTPTTPSCGNSETLFPRSYGELVDVTD